VKLFQQALGVPADGIWGTVTDGAFLKLDPLV
jgi:peptidoglycan hydrolase-like protein with peptidoglycan-binding domain